MSLEEENLNQNEGVRGLLKEDHKAELGKVLAFGERYKKEGEEMKKEFWRKGRWENFVNLLMQYKDRKKEYMENLTGEEKEVLDRLNEVGKDKFIEGYMHDKILYSGDKEKEMKRKQYGYGDWMVGNIIMERGERLLLNGKNIGDEGAETISKMELKEGVTFDLTYNNIGDEGAEAISRMKLKEGVVLGLARNNIGAAGAEAISKMELKEGVKLDLWNNHIGDAGAEALSKMELKEGVRLDLRSNKIGDAGAEAISRMELKEGVNLNLSYNKIGDAGAEAIMKNLELKEGIDLILMGNNISKETEDKLRKWAEGYRKRGISFEITV